MKQQVKKIKIDFPDVYIVGDKILTETLQLNKRFKDYCEERDKE